MGDLGFCWVCFAEVTGCGQYRLPGLVDVVNLDVMGVQNFCYLVQSGPAMGDLG